MKVHKTAAFTAVWRKMGHVDNLSTRHVPFSLRIIGRLLGMLDRPSVATISKRTIAINSLIKEAKPEIVVEIGCGYSSRPEVFPETKFYQLDLRHIADRKDGVMQFDASKDALNLGRIKDAFFVVEGLTMYLDEDEVDHLLKEIKKYKGQLAIDFFSRQKSTKEDEKSFKERLYKLIFRASVGKPHLFDFRIDDISSGKRLLEKSGFKKVKHIKYNLAKTLDELFYAEF